ncbi:MAG: transglutaminase-like cysteine peptidase [Pseudomonadota bacterium]
MHYVLVFLLSWAACCTAMAGAAGYAFSDDPASGASVEHPLWAQVLARDARQSATLSACLADQRVCDRHLRGWQRIVHRAEGLNPHAQLVLINRFMNKRRYVDDAIDPGTGVGVWNTLNDFLRDGGDCEDFAIAKYFTLRRLGFAAEDMRIVVAFDRHARDFHALLAVNLDGHAWFLENDNTILRGGELRPYAFSYAVNEDFWWDHDNDAVSRRYDRD